MSELRQGLRLHIDEWINGIAYDANGYNINGFDAMGYDVNGLDIFGNPCGFWMPTV